MKVLIDIHHHDLFRSLNILFHKRLGWDIYLLYGMDWHDEWKFYSTRCAVQYLESVKSWYNAEEDLSNIKFCTLEEFASTEFDVVVGSFPGHWNNFNDVIKHYGKKTKVIAQIGNNVPASEFDPFCKNLLSSSWVSYMLSRAKNKVFYHQEFDTTDFCPPIPSTGRLVTSLLHFFRNENIPSEEYKMFLSLKEQMPDFSFRCFGQGGECGVSKDVSKNIKESTFIYHVKPGGDGYGYVYHYAAACGKPIIYRKKYLYYNEFCMTPLFLLNDDIAIDLDQYSLKQVEDRMREMKSNYADVSAVIRNNFCQVVNFDEEFERIKVFLADLI